MSGNTDGIAKEKVNTADTPARPGANSAETPEHQSKIDRVAEDSAKRAGNREAHNADSVISK